MSDFFIRLMSYPSRRFAARKKEVKEKKISPKELFKVVLEADVGHDREERQEAFYAHHLAKLSEKELEKLLKKMEQILHEAFDESEKEESARASHFLQETLKPRLRRSKFNVKGIEARVWKKMEAFESLQFTEESLTLNEKTCSYRAFVLAHFSEEVQLYDQLVAEGQIIPLHKRLGGVGVVTQMVKRFIER